jgi:hypothetical protein
MKFGLAVSQAVRRVSLTGTEIDFPGVLLFSPVNIIPPFLSILIYHMRDEK